MPRNTAGQYSSPASNFSPNTVISSSVMNSKLTDLGDEITASLSRNGDGDMLAPLRVPNGTINLPSLSFSNDTTIGFRLAAVADMRASDDGTDIFRFTATGNRSYQPLAISTGGLTVDAGGLTVTAGGGTITAGGLTVTAGNTSLGGGVTGPSGGALVVGNGLTVTTGGATVTAGGATITAGGLTVAAGGSALTGTTAAANGTVAPHIATNSGATSSTNSDTHALLNVNATTPGPNTLKFTVRTKNDASGTISNADNVSIGFSGDVDSTAAANGSFYLGRLTNTMATGVAVDSSTARAALEITNGNLKLSGTAPASTVAAPNTLTPSNIPKALALVTTDGTGGASVVWGFGIASVAINSTELRVTFASSFTPAPSAGNPSYLTDEKVGTQGEIAYPLPASYTANSYDVRVHSTTTSTATPGTPGTMSLATNARTLKIVAYGNQ